MTARPMDKLKRILLVNPVNAQRGLATTSFTKCKPMSLGVLAKLTPPDIEVVVIDENFENFEEKILSAGKIDLAGITAFTSTVTRAYEIAEKLKDDGIPVVMGGIHVSFFPDEALGYCDSVVVGEAEGVWEKLLEDARAGALGRVYRQEKKAEDVKIGSFPNGIFSDKYFWGAVQTSRGCPMNCDFCTVTIFNGFKYRLRPIDEIISELKEVKQKHVFFYDDNIVGRTAEQKARAVDLFERIVKEGIKKDWFCQCSINVGEDDRVLKAMYKSGCRMMLVGFESVDPDNLKAMNKGTNLNLLKRYEELINRIHSHGIAVLGSFMVGYPFDSRKTIKTLPEFINKMGVDAFQLTHLTPFPGTKLYDRLISEGRITKASYPGDWSKYNFSNVVYSHDSLSEEELVNIVYGVKNVLTLPLMAVWGRFFRTLLSTRSFSTAVIALMWNLGVRKAYVNGINARKKTNKN